MKMSIKKELAGLLCLLLSLGLFLFASNSVLVTKRNHNGAVWDFYQNEPKDSIDVLFLGSSVAYCDVIPAVIYEETGITSFVMAGPSQTIPVTYRYLHQACTTQSPKAVFVEVSNMLFNRQDPSIRSSVKVNTLYMPQGGDRLTAVLEEAPEEERLGLLFPLYAYHSRWQELTKEDLLKGLFGYGTDPMAGYTFLNHALPFQEITYPRTAGNTEDFSDYVEYLQKMAAFCSEQGIRLIFYSSPMPVANSPQLNQMLEEACSFPGVEYWNLQEDMDPMAIDLSEDFYDTMHFNYRGAEKFSAYLAQRIAGLGLSPSDSADDELWAWRAEYFTEQKAEWDGRPLPLKPTATGGTS